MEFHDLVFEGEGEIGVEFCELLEDLESILVVVLVDIDVVKIWVLNECCNQCYLVFAV